jgi:hypothetical protein
MSGPTASNSSLHKECPEETNTNLLRVSAGATRRETSSSIISRLQLREERTVTEKNTRTPRGIPKFSSPEQSFAGSPRQDTQHQRPEAPHTGGKSLGTPAQQRLPQPESQRTGHSVRTLSSFDSDKLKVAAVVQQIVTGLGEAVSEKHKIIIFIKMVLNWMKRKVC